jgi:hemolysin activation/secretion protein
LFILLAYQAQAQTDALHLIGPGQLRVPQPQRSTRMPAGSVAHVAAPQANLGGFVLHKIVIDGTSSASAAALARAAAPAIGHQVNGTDIGLIAERIGSAESAAGIALYTVSIPVQRIRDGVLHFRVTEGSVTHVVIQGASHGRRLQLIRSYAGKIMRSRPLRRQVLEQNILLMGDIAGTKLGSQFIANLAHPGEETLLLTVRQTRYFGGFSLNNQGAPLLDNTQSVFNAGINDLFHEGERTQLVLGLPLDVTRYQFYGINDVEPFGGNGITLSLDAGVLASHPQGDDVESGTAGFGSAELDDPLIRSVHQDVTLGGGFSYLNSSNAFLGFTTSVERTRALRISIAYNDDKYFNGVNRVGAALSQGLDILGARLASPAYVGPSFTKETLKIERFQILPANFVLHVSVSGQTTTDRLPPSQEFEYGGADYGQAFYAAELAGDEGIAGLGEISHVIPADYLPTILRGTTLFSSLDYGRIWNRASIYVPSTDRGASFAAGLRLMLMQKVQLQLAAAAPLITPQTVPGTQRWRFVVGTSGQF